MTTPQALEGQLPLHRGAFERRTIMAYGKCFLCGKYGQVERHHAFPGALRDKSEEYGLTVDLCALECHREGKKAVHKCKESRLKVQKYCQKKAMREQGWSVEDFIREFGKNYLDPEDLFGFRLLEPVALFI